MKISSLSTKIILALMGMSYFAIFSNLDISPFIRGYVAIVPVQILALFYIFYRESKQKS